VEGAFTVGMKATAYGAGGIISGVINVEAGSHMKVLHAAPA
jgi:hypothetical protein